MNLDPFVTLATVADLTTMARFAYEFKATSEVQSWNVIALARQVSRLAGDVNLREKTKRMALRRPIEDNAQEVMAHVALDKVTPADMELSGYIGHYAAEQYAWQEVGHHDLEALNAAVIRMHDIPSDSPSKECADAAAITTQLFSLLWHFRKYGELQRSRRDMTIAHLRELPRQGFVLSYAVLFDGVMLGGVS